MLNGWVSRMLGVTPRRLDRWVSWAIVLTILALAVEIGLCLTGQQIGWWCR